jgi:predicted Zn-dependent protease
LANGTIYVNTGLLAKLENEAQLASVLAHEATHVIERHGYLENRSFRKKMVAMHVMAAVGSVAGAVGGVAGTSVSIFANLLPSIVVATIYGYSRELERDADKRAVVALADADYSTEEMINTFRLLKKSDEVELSKVFYSDHPKLDERIAYVTDLVQVYRPRSRHPKVEEEVYNADVEKAARHNIGLDIAEGRARTATAVAENLVRRHPNSSEDAYLLGEAFRALGPRTREPTPEELSNRGKNEARKMVQKMTLQEYEAALMAKPQGKATWEANSKKAEEAYQKALELDASNAKVHRGLGFLYEKQHQVPQCLEQFRKYLELSPDAMDRLQITHRIEALDKDLPKGTPPVTP